MTVFKPLCVLLPFLFASPLVSAEIFKCPRGKTTVYQNFPCAVDSIGSTATAPAPSEPAAPVPVNFAEPKAGKGKLAAAERSSGSATEPRIGMTKNQVKASAWGEPIDAVGEEVVEGMTYDLAKRRTVSFDVTGRVSTLTQ